MSIYGIVSSYFSLLLFSSLIEASDVRSMIAKAQQPSSYKLTSSTSSYAQYSAWYPCLTGSLIFEFQTHEPNALLVYTQALPYKYIQINLIDGHLRMRMRIGEKDDPRGIILSYEKTRLNDQKWHEIKLTRQNERTIITIDNKQTLFHVHKDANLEGFDLYFASHSNDFNLKSQSNLLVFGGIPNYFQTFDLSLGTALFEQRFNGYIRNVRALNCTAQHMTTLHVTENNNLRYVNDFDACMSSPCLNYGACLITDDLDGYKCDCSYSSFEGKNCDLKKPPQSSHELTFTGKEYFSFEIPTDENIGSTYEEEFNIDFKTSRSTGLLAYAGNTQDYIVIGIQDGGIYFKLNIKGQSTQKTLTIPGIILHNDQWHSVRFTRKVKQIEILIDNIKRDLSSVSGQFISMKTRLIYVGGAPKHNTIYRSIRKNFIGCLRNVTFKSHKVSLNLIDMALGDHKQITTHGKLQTSCHKLIDPVTFDSPNSYIPITNWYEYPKLFSFSIDFQTTENYGVLAYILGSDNNFKTGLNNDQSPLLSLNRDFFSLEIHNRFLNAYFNFGAEYIRYEVVDEPVSNGKPHQLTIEINNKFVSFKFDEKHEKILNLDNSHSNILELTGPLTIGGINPKHQSTSGLINPSASIPPYFFSGMLGHGFVGCIQDVEINGHLTNLTEFAVLEGVSGVSSGICSPMPSQCEIGHCMNDGVCVEGWNRFVCDCSATGFNAPICNQPATISNFAQDQYISIKFEPEWVSEAEHLSLRFKTAQIEDSILLSTYTPFSNDRMEITLENSQIKLYLKIGDSETILFSKERMNDNQWHTIKIMREGIRLIFQVDINEPSTGMLTKSNSRKGMFLLFTFIDIGTSIYSRSQKNKKPFMKDTIHNALAYEKLSLGNALINHKNSEYSQRVTNSFEGQMQQLIINGKSYFELINNNDLSEIVTRTVSFLRTDLPHKYPLTFHDVKSWITLPKIDAFHILLVQFHFKTAESHGIILYNAGQNNDYFAVELSNGQISYRFSLGNVNNIIRSKSKTKLNDNKWHLVSIWRSTKTNHELTVDSLVYKHSSSDNEHTVFNLVGNLYVGGLSSQLEYQKLSDKSEITSKHGFKGCLASIEINGRVPDINDVIRGKHMNGHVTQGCENVATGCKAETCKNDGICIEKWEMNQQICNCQMTTFIGDRCDAVSFGYFVDKSELYFNYNSPLYAEDISLVFGIETKSLNGLIFKAESSRTGKTIIIEIKNGYIQATFSDGYGVNNFHKFSKYQVNNEKYHILKLLVVDNNSTLTVNKKTSDKTIISEKPLNYQPIIHTDSGRVSLQIGGSNDIDLSTETNSHIIKTIPKLASHNTQPDQHHLFQYTLPPLKPKISLPETRDHLFKILHTVTDPSTINEESEKIDLSLARDHLLGLEKIHYNNDQNNADRFIGNIYGLVYNQFRVLDLIAQKDSRTKVNGTATLLENNQINRVDEYNLGCDEKNLKNCGYTDSDTQHIKKITSHSSTSNDYYDYSIQDINNDIKSPANRGENTMSSNSETSSVYTPMSVDVSTTEEPFSPLFNYSQSLMTTLIISFFLILCILIIAVCKYRNRDEGTYTIDETKNCGPFAEMDAPLNGSARRYSKTPGKNNNNNRRNEISNKEWYV